MNEKNSSNNITTFNQQITSLIRLVDHTSEIITKTFSVSPYRVMENLNRLNQDILLLSKQVIQLENKNKNLLALVDIGQVINSSLELREVLRIVMDTIVRLIKAERGFLMLRNREGNLSIYVARNWDQESIHPSDFALSRTIVKRVITNGQPILTTNAQEDPRFGNQDSVITNKLRSILCVPLKVKNKLTGAIYTDNRIHSGIFTDYELELLIAFSNQAAVAIENARLFEDLKRTLDEVTKLNNLLDNVFASIASGVITVDIENKITLCNRAAEEILGQNQSGLVGYNLADVLPSVGSSLVKHIKIVRQTDQNIEGIECNITLARRGQVFFRFNLSPLKDSDQSTKGVAIVLEDLTEKKRLEAQQRLFERMVSPVVIEQLDPDKLRLGGERTEITTLFVDIRGFTGFSEGQDPEQLVSVLNHYLAAAAEAVLARDGTIDKFLGDAVMAWFNAPIPQPDHALRAIKTALDIKKAIHHLRTNLPPEFRLSCGTGIHSGEAVLGLVGTEKRLEYTAIGDSVNIAKRIQENAEAGQILISTEAYARVKDQVVVRFLEPLHVKGKSQPVHIYELLDLKKGTGTSTS